MACKAEGGDAMAEGEGGGDSDGAGTQADEAGGVLSRPAGMDLDWTPGRFAAFAMDATNPVSVLLGKIVEVREGSEGREALLEWYSPARNARLRSKYGRGAWSPVFNPDKPSEPDTSLELVDVACITFGSLLLGNKLPSAVWAAVAAQVPPPEDRVLDDGDLEQEEERGEGGIELDQPSRQEGERAGGDEAQPSRQEGEGAGGEEAQPSRQEDEGAGGEEAGRSQILPITAGDSVDENGRVRRESRAGRVRFTAAFSRPRRGGSSSA